MRRESTKKLNNDFDLKDITTYQAGILQATAHRVLQKYSDQILKKYGITKMQWLIIGTVYDCGNKGIRLTELTAKLDTTMAYLTNAVNLLESKKILNRIDDNKDFRVKFITVNKSFKPKCSQIEKTLRDELRKTIYNNVNPADFATYIRVLKKLSKISE